MNNRKNIRQSSAVLLLRAMVFAALLFSLGCSSGHLSSDQGQENEQIDKAMVTISGDGIENGKTLTLKEMLRLPDAKYEHVYSTVNNYPTRKKFVARGIKLEEIMKATGLTDKARLIVFKSEDDYETVFTKEQLLDTPRFYFAGIMTGDSSGAERVEPILAYEFADNSENLNDLRPDELTLIIPQAFVDEQTNQVFTKGVREIVVSTDEPGKWDMAAAFPAPGAIAKGESVKLQHKDLGKVKIYYTLDGSTPTEKSMLYNPSTFQPELNKPIPIQADIVIKALVKGFGKHDSEIAVLSYQVP